MHCVDAGEASLRLTAMPGCTLPMATLDKLAVKPARRQKWVETHTEVYTHATYMFVSSCLYWHLRVYSSVPGPDNMEAPEKANEKPADRGADRSKRKGIAAFRT